MLILIVKKQYLYSRSGMAFQVDACYIIAIRKKQEFSLRSILIIYNNITIAICQVKNRPDSIPNPFMYKY